MLGTVENQNTLAVFTRTKLDSPLATTTACLNKSTIDPLAWGYMLAFNNVVWNAVRILVTSTHGRSREMHALPSTQATQLKQTQWIMKGPSGRQDVRVQGHLLGAEAFENLHSHRRWSICFMLAAPWYNSPQLSPNSNPCSHQWSPFPTPFGPISNLQLHVDGTGNCAKVLTQAWKSWDRKHSGPIVQSLKANAHLVRVTSVGLSGMSSVPSLAMPFLGMLGVFFSMFHAISLVLSINQ